MENTCEIPKFIIDLERFLYISIVDLKLLIAVLCLKTLKLSI